MKLNYHISPAPDISENLVIRVYEAQAPEAVIYTETLNAPHSAPRSVTVNGLDKVVHIVRLYGATSNTLYHWYEVQPSSESATVFDPIRFKIGDGGANTPAANSKTYQNDILKDLLATDYKITRNNYGILFHGSHYTVTTAAGSFTLMGDDQFNEGEEFIIERKPVISKTVGNDSVVGKWFAGAVDISSNMAYDPAHLRKHLRFSGSCEYNLTGAIPIGYVFCFNHYGTPGTGVVKFSNAPLKWGTGTKATISIPSETEAAFWFDGTQWNVVQMSDGVAAAATDPVPGSILGVGEFLLVTPGYQNGDVPPGDYQWTVNHGKGISGDYTVQLTLKTNNAAQFANNNKIGAPTWWHSANNKANQFHFTLQEIDSVQNNISVVWTLIKL